MKLNGFIDQHELSIEEMNGILANPKSPRKQKEQVRQIHKSIDNISRKMDIPKWRLSPMINSRGEIYVWFD